MEPLICETGLKLYWGINLSLLTQILVFIESDLNVCMKYEDLSIIAGYSLLN